MKPYLMYPEVFRKIELNEKLSLFDWTVLYDLEKLIYGLNIGKHDFVEVNSDYIQWERADAHSKGNNAALLSLVEHLKNGGYITEEFLLSKIINEEENSW